MQLWPVAQGWEDGGAQHHQEGGGGHHEGEVDIQDISVRNNNIFSAGHLTLISNLYIENIIISYDWQKMTLRSALKP